MSVRTSKGFTLVEMAIVVGIVAVLVTMVVGVAKRIDNRAKERVTRETLALIDLALEQYRQFGYTYTFALTDTNPEMDFYRSLKFPVDFNSYNEVDIESGLADIFNLNAGDVSILPNNIHTFPEHSGCEVMYFFLSQVPECRKILGEIDDSFLTSEVSNNQSLYLTIQYTVSDIQEYPLIRIIDPWGQTLGYDYYKNQYEIDSPPTSWQWRDGQESRRAFPLVISAGADGQFGTDDDIQNRKK